MGLFDKFVVMKGLNRRTIAVKNSQVTFLEEQEIDGTVVTNIHLTNGRWMTAGLPLNEAMAVLTYESSDDAAEQEREKKSLESWRRLAQGRAKAQKEVNEALALVGPSLKYKSYNKELMPDGSGRLVIEFEPRSEGEAPVVED